MKSGSATRTAALASVMMLLLTACGGDEGEGAAEPTESSEEQDAPEPDAPEPDAEEGEDDAAEGDRPEGLAEDWDAITAAAADEGEVVVALHVGPGYQDWAELADAALPDIDVVATVAPPANTIPRIVQEQASGQYLWDVYMGASGNLATTLAPADGAEVLAPWFAALPDDFQQDDDWGGGFELYADDQGRFFVHQLQLSGGITVNRDLAPDLDSPEDILDPQYQGQIVVWEPTATRAGAIAIASLIEEYGEDYARTILLEQDPIVVSDGDQVNEWVADGRAAIGFGGGLSEMEALHEAGIGLETEHSHELTSHLSAFSTTILKNPPNPNAAAVFMAWALSQEGQEAWAETVRVDASSRRQDVSKPDDVDYANLNSYGAIFGTAEGQALADIVTAIAEEM